MEVWLLCRYGLCQVSKNQLTEPFKGSAANVLDSRTLEVSDWHHVSMAQNCFGGTKGNYTILGIFNVMADW